MNMTTGNKYFTPTTMLTGRSQPIDSGMYIYAPITDNAGHTYKSAIINGDTADDLS